jgi:transcription-repair coupling factor (superfamily II helicase)
MSLKKFIEENKEDKIKIYVLPEYFNINIDIKNTYYYPDFDIFPFENIDVSSNIKNQRINVLNKIKKNQNINIITTFHSLTRYTIPPEEFKNIKYKMNENYDENLFEMGYQNVSEVRNNSEYSKRGFIRDLYIPGEVLPNRIELFDKEIDRITYFDYNNQKSIKNIESIEIIPGSEILKFKENINKMKERIRDTIDINQLNTFPALFYKNKKTLFSYIKNDYEIIFINKDEIIKTFSEKEKENFEMCDDENKKLIYKEFSGLPLEIINTIKYKEYTLNLKNNTYKLKKENNTLESLPLIDWEDLKEDDLVVHEDYGIALYKGIRKMKNALGEREYITLEYASKSRVFVPVERLDKLSKYLGDKDTINISNLNGKKWKNTKKKVEEKIKQKVKQLIKIYALRENQKGIIIKGDEELEDQLKKTFPYIETLDQIKCIEEINSDLENLKPMDRLLVGDAGFGKTEVAIRAAFKTIISNYQVLFLAPTTILSSQHYETLKERYEPFGINIELLNRNTTPKNREKIINNLKNGIIDILIGTHSLLSEKINPKKLGLVIIDEEQRFGVLQKEKFKNLSKGVNFLMMSATPIPRTLYMSISGLREISTISTPPIGRIPIQSFIGKYSERIVRTAALREKGRGGQILYVHNRINTIEKVYKKLKDVIPELKIEYIHGRMNKSEINKKIKQYYEGEIDLLISTSIVENGIDIPNVNTLIIDDSQRYGISQLYQIKGRVGRSNKRAFAYFLYKDEKLKEESQKRLEAIKKFNEPGSGLKLALRDLEIRGYGDLLGLDQKGHINSVGLHLYKNILEKVTNELLNEKEKEIIKNIEYTEIIGIRGNLLIPEKYISNSIDRMRIYRRISVSKNIDEVEELKNEINDRYGKIPIEVKELFEYAKIRVKASNQNIKEIEIDEKYIRFKFSEEVTPNLNIYKKYSKKVIYENNVNELISYGIKDPIKYLYKILEIGE